MNWIELQIPIVAAMNQKGGVGKTLTVGLIAEWFALVRHKKVLLIDLDMQCNSSDQWVGMDLAPNVIGGQLPPHHPNYNPEYGVNERSSIADIFYGKPVLPYDTWLNEEVCNGGFVDLMCGHPRYLEEVNTAFAKSINSLEENVLNRLREFLASDDIQETYDLILLDTGPSRTPIFRSAMRAATDIIIPFRPEEKDIQGITAMLQVVRQENYSRPNETNNLNLIGLLPNMIRNTKLHNTNLNRFVTAHPDITFPKECWLHHLTAFPERDTQDSRPKSVFELAKSNDAKIQATAMASFVEENIFNTKKSAKKNTKSTVEA